MERRVVNTFANVVVGALTLAAVYALVGSGFVILYRATGVLNFAQGAFLAAGALVFYSFTHDYGWSLYPALIAAVLCLAVFGALVYVVIFSRLIGLSQLVVSIATVGLGVVLQMLSNILWGSGARTLPNLISYRRIVVLGHFSMTPADIFVFVLGVLGVAAVAAFLKFTRTGLRMRATADSPVLAAYTGARPARMSALAWSLAAATAAAAGIGYSLQSQLDPSTLNNLGLAIFPAIILGGLDSVAGAALGALILGLVQSTAGVTLGGQWESPVGYLVLIAVIMIRSRGLLGSAHVARL
jgi:branched-chain amino acid transport system permease protein